MARVRSGARRGRGCEGEVCTGAYTTSQLQTKVRCLTLEVCARPCELRKHELVRQQACWKLAEERTASISLSWRWLAVAQYRQEDKALLGRVLLHSFQVFRLTRSYGLKVPKVRDCCLIHMYVSPLIASGASTAQQLERAAEGELHPTRHSRVRGKCAPLYVTLEA